MQLDLLVVRPATQGQVVSVQLDLLLVRPATQGQEVSVQLDAKLESNNAVRPLLAPVWRIRII